MELVFDSAALKQLRAKPKADAAKIKAAMQEIADTHPRRMSYVTELAGQPGMWRVRKGNYRAIYFMTGKTIIVAEVEHRKDIYQ